MKIKKSIKKRCTWCRVVKRHHYFYIYCKKFKRHKQKQG